jgi:hypothetical protein
MALNRGRNAAGDGRCGRDADEVERSERGPTREQLRGFAACGDAIEADRYRKRCPLVRRPGLQNHSADLR